MKAIICLGYRGAGGEVHLFSPGAGRWAVCPCGQAGGRWEDPRAGRLIVAARGGLDRVRVLGLSNTMLAPAISQGGTWEDHRAWHEEATQAPGYIFDASRAACWAVVVKVGQTTDIRAATETEYLECFP